MNPYTDFKKKMILFPLYPSILSLKPKKKDTLPSLSEMGTVFLLASCSLPSPAAHSRNAATLQHQGVLFDFPLQLVFNSAYKMPMSTYMRW